jgi:predicted DNA-binding transcriptional regulator AlpA
MHGPGEAQTKVQTHWATDTLISIHDIRELFGLGRTAAYELTHRSGFPEPIKLSPRCYRWSAGEVIAFIADVRLRNTPSCRSRGAERTAHRSASPNDLAPLRITGTMRVARSRKAS